jgi:endonuclease/exonuclease/phosphatase family metal-dependent hydrolase
MAAAPLRLATWNVLSGRAPDVAPGGGIDSDALARAVIDLDADVIALQEVDHAQPRSGERDQTADLIAAVRTGYDDASAVTGSFLPTLIGTPGLRRSWAPAGPVARLAPGTPAYGIAVITRLPVLAWHELRLPGSWGRMPMLVPTPGGRVAPVLIPDEPRAALAVVVETGSGGRSRPLTVIGTHLSFVPPRALLQLRAVTRWARGLPGPQVLLGDLNLPGAVPARVSGWRRLAAVATWPAGDPRVQLDHALAHGLAGARVEASRAAQAEVSDHRAVIVDLSL